MGSSTFVFRRCFRKWFIRSAVLCLGFVAPINFMVLKMEVEVLNTSVPWGEDFKIQEATRRNSLPSEREMRGEENVASVPVFLANIRQTILRWFGAGDRLTEDELADILRLWPKGSDTDDRILRQMNWRRPTFTPKHVTPAKNKIIIDFNGLVHRSLHGRRKFELDECPIRNCLLKNRSPVENETLAYDAMIFRSPPPFSFNKSEDQIWVWFALESPLHTGQAKYLRNRVNWTATYRRDSTLVAPYEKFVHYLNFTKLPDKPLRNYAKGKRKQVAWFVSNCKDQNGRLAYAKELSLYINVDMFGACGTLQCPRAEASACYHMLNKDYKFYLSFENSNCHDYVTEKLFWNALNNDIIPIVMGARPEDYQSLAPPGSYIHTEDFGSPQELAEYLKVLDKSDTLYNQYFRWKGTGTFIDTKFWCRLCSLLHAQDYTRHVTWYDDVSKWWWRDRQSESVCLRRALSNTTWVQWKERKSPGSG